MDLSVLWWWTSTYQNLKGWPSQKCELQSFVFQKVPIWQQLLYNQLEGFEYNFRYLKWFFRKLPRKLRSAFFLKLRFLKIGILVTWLKCLTNYGYIEVGFPRAWWQSWLEISSLQSFHQLVSRSQLFCLDFENYLGVWRLQALRQLGLWWPCGRLHFLSII